MALDPETKQLLTDADHLRLMVESAGWRLAKAKLDARIIDLQNINNLDVAMPLEPQILGRKMAADEMFAWLKADIYGFIEQQDTANQHQREEGDHIARQ